MRAGRTKESLLESIKLELGRVHESVAAKRLGWAEQLGLLEEQAARYLELFGSRREVEEFVGAREDELLRTIRTNTLKISRGELIARLREKGLEVREYALTSYGVVVEETPISLAALHEHLLGLFYIQGPASMLPVHYSGAEKAERIVDACAGAGGKTTQAAQHNPSAVIVAVDKSPRKLMALKANTSRLGVFNVVSVNMDARRLRELGSFDLVILDAPCSGEGLMPFRRGRRKRSSSEIRGRVLLQAELLLAASSALRDGGALVYSTCSISFEENEYVVSRVAESVGLKFVPTGIPGGEPGITDYAGLRALEEARLCRRFYPHRHRTEGFTVCMLRKEAGN